MLEKPRRHPLRRWATIALFGSLATLWLMLVKTRDAFPENNVSALLVGCQEERSNVVFLKTHKCASTTLQNIFMRYGDVHNLKFVLPSKSNYLGHPATFHHSMVLENPCYTYNILTHHTRFDRQEMCLVMPKDTIYVTVLREPVLQFESMYSYYDLETFYGATLEQIEKMDVEQVRHMLSQRYVGRIGRNQMAFDLGLDPQDFDDPLKVAQFVEHMDRSFQLVMLAERMEESLVLLKDLLCWDTRDVVTFRLNGRSERDRRPVSRNLEVLVRNISQADHRLYEHFRDKFERTVRAFGFRAMRAEVLEQRRQTEQWKQRCLDPEQTADSSSTRRTTDPACRRMLEPELKYTSLLRRRQRTMLFTVNCTVPKLEGNHTC